jgi:hypothetical protein
LVSCRSEEYDLPDDVVWVSPHFAYHSRSGDPSVCEGILSKLEQHLSAMQALLGFSWPDGRTIHYYKFTTQEDFATKSPCPGGSAACTERNSIYAYTAFEQHELIHGYLWPTGLPPAVIAEGTALALVCNRAIPESPSLSLKDALSVGNPLSDQRVYETGARFVRYLIDAYGPRAFLRFYAELNRGSWFGDLDQAMHAVFDVSADVAWAAALATPPSCPHPYECSRERIPLDGTPIDVASTCGLVEDTRTFDLTNDQVVVTGASSVFVGICEPIRFSTIRVTAGGSADEQVGLMQLPEGHYYLSVRDPEPTTVKATAATVPWAGVDCAALASLSLPAGQPADLRVSVAAIPPSWAVKLRFEESRQLTVRWPTGATLSICADCSESSCRTVSSTSPRWYVPSPGDYVLRLRASNRTEVMVLDILAD